MKRHLFFWAITAALAGFLFGFDTVVISGAEQKIQSLWGLSASMHGLAIASALYGTVLGSLLGGWPTDRFGRKATLLCIGVFYLVGAIWSGLATDVYSFIMARGIGGLGIGISTVVAPLYISEISPPKYRGRLAGMFQFNIVFGILVALLSNYLLSGIGENAWRWMLGVAAFPSLVYTVLCFTLPESPRWLLVRKGNRAEGLRVLRLMEPEASPTQIEAEADGIVAASPQKATGARFSTRRLPLLILLAILIAVSGIWTGKLGIPILLALLAIPVASSNLSIWQTRILSLLAILIAVSGVWTGRLGIPILLALLAIPIASFDLWTWRLRIPIMLAILIAFFNQLSGINAILYFAPRIFEMTGLGSKAALLQSVGIGVTNFIFTFVGLWLIDRLGRRTMLLIGSFGYIASLSLVAWAFFAGHVSIVPVCIFAFIAAHAVGQGAVIWVFIAEIFPNRYRAEGQSLGCYTHWIFCALLATYFPQAADSFKEQPGYIFAFFAFMMVLQLFWVITMVPETKGVPLEEMQERLGIKGLVEAGESLPEQSASSRP